MKKSIKISGDGFISEGEYDVVKIMGDVSSIGNVYAREVKINGDAEFRGNLDFGQLNVRGNTHINGDIKVGQVKISGDLLVDGNADIEKLVLVGDCKFSSDIKCDIVDIDGDIDIESNIYAKEININNNKIFILGLVENRIDEGESFYEKANSRYFYNKYNLLFNELESKNGIKIVLSHYPENFAAIGEESYNKYNFNIMFSGHAHGGQFILPFIGGLFAPGQGILPKYYRGIHGEKNKLIISRGLGNSGFPLRLFNRPEVIVVDIYNEKII